METGAQPLPRVRGTALSLGAFRRLAWVSAGMLVLIVATGATVRLTGSGLGCEHWPGCEQHHFEPKSFHSYIEFSNRVVAFFTILATLLDVRRRDLGAAVVAAPGTRVRDLLRHVAAGAARRDHDPLPPQPLARAVALPALGRRADAWRRARRRGERPAVRARASVRAAGQPVGRRRGVRADRQRHARDRRRPASGQHGRAPPLVVRAGGVLARAGDRGVRAVVRGAARVAGRATAARTFAVRCSCSDCSPCR